MANSPIVSFTKLSPNHSGKRTCSISRITPHAVVGQLSVERICDCFKDSSRQASCNYCIGTDGRIGLCVDEQNRSWCSSSRDNDQRSVTIECASDLTEPYTMKPEVYVALVNLCVDTCRRNDKSSDQTSSRKLSILTKYFSVIIHDDFREWNPTNNPTFK